MKQRLKKAGGRAGKAIGSLVPGGRAAGRTLGRGAGTLASRLIGSGDYKVNDGVAMNSLFTGSRANSASFGSTGDTFRVRHDEFIMDITTTATQGQFYNNSFAINPGNEALAPLLANLALNFEKYRMRGLVFMFRSSTSPYFQYGAMGTYVMTMAYNASAPLYTSKTQAENSDFAISARLDESAAYGVECARDHMSPDFLYVQSPGITTPVNLTDMGTFQLCIAPGAQIPANSVLGELWVSYDIEFASPRLGLTRTGYFHVTRTGCTAAAAPLGTLTTWSKAFGTLDGVIVTSTTIEFPNARVGDTYDIQLSWLGSNTGNAAATPVMTNTNVTPYLAYQAGTASVSTGGSGSLTTNLSLSRIVTVTNAIAGTNPSISFGLAGVIPTGACTLDILIEHVGNGFAALAL